MKVNSKMKKTYLGFCSISWSEIGLLDHFAYMVETFSENKMSLLQ